MLILIDMICKILLNFKMSCPNRDLKFETSGSLPFLQTINDCTEVLILNGVKSGTLFNYISTYPNGMWCMFLIIPFDASPCVVDVLMHT